MSHFDLDRSLHLPYLPNCVTCNSNCFLRLYSHYSPCFGSHNFLQMTDSSAAAAMGRDKPLLSSGESTQDKNGTTDPVPARKPKMADYLRVFSYATKWDFCIYAVACFASIAGGATMPLSKEPFFVAPLLDHLFSVVPSSRICSSNF